MTEKTKNTTKKQTVEAEENVAAVVTSHLSQDLKSSLLIVSLVANLAVLTAWIAIQVTSQYDSQLVSFLFSR
ncbi:MAG TPA: hypothetical protein VK502_02685 [Candidatus Saccharimonadales bacterium]|jgi:hypothetical protein|nr:hypothetical protein [Candidatus Saccharimonadales bacterium]